MSNVLIGIIGVILFIGLALAGALILGDDFRSASASSQAAAAAQTLLQVQSAIDMWRLKTGQSGLANGTTAFLAPRFLKTTASNPTRIGMANAASYQYQPKTNNDVCPDTNDENARTDAKMLHFPVGYGIEDKGVCQALADIYSNGTIADTAEPTGTIGCVHVDGPAMCSIPGQWYMAYSRAR